MSTTATLPAETPDHAGVAFHPPLVRVDRGRPVTKDTLALIEYDQAQGGREAAHRGLRLPRMKIAEHETAFRGRQERPLHLQPLR